MQGSHPSLPRARYPGAGLAAVLSCDRQLCAGVALTIHCDLWTQRHTGAPVPARSFSSGWPRVYWRCLLHSYLQCSKRNLVLGFLNFRVRLPMYCCIWERNEGWLLYLLGMWADSSWIGIVLLLPWELPPSFILPNYPCYLTLQFCQGWGDIERVKQDIRKNLLVRETKICTIFFLFMGKAGCQQTERWDWVLSVQTLALNETKLKFLFTLYGVGQKPLCNLNVIYLRAVQGNKWIRISVTYICTIMYNF